MKNRLATAVARIVVVGLSQVCSAVPQAGHPNDNDPDLVAIRQYRLTMDKVDKLVAATEALRKLADSNPSLKQRMEGDSDSNQTIDQKVKYFDTNFPQATAVVHSSGLTTREYVLVSLAFLNDVMIVGMKKQGMIKEYPANAITPENAAFVEQNFDKLKQVSEKLSPAENGQ